jgi:hypothetical protein
MSTCPVCEHVQSTGDECEVCGRKLADAPPAPPVPALAGLEPTLHEPGASATGDPVPRLVGLEPTRYEAPPEVAPPPPSDASVPDLESARSAPVGEVPVEAVPDLEHHLAEPVPDDPELPRQGPAVCRYCRTPAMPNDRFCGRCGMRLARFEPVRMAASERGELVCPDCGAMGTGPRCRRCGARMASPA